MGFLRKLFGSGSERPRRGPLERFETISQEKAKQTDDSVSVMQSDLDSHAESWGQEGLDKSLQFWTKKSAALSRRCQILQEEAKRREAEERYSKQRIQSLEKQLERMLVEREKKGGADAAGGLGEDFTATTATLSPSVMTTLSPSNSLDAGSDPSKNQPSEQRRLSTEIDESLRSLPDGQDDLFRNAVTGYNKRTFKRDMSKLTSGKEIFHHSRTDLESDDAISSSGSICLDAESSMDYPGRNLQETRLQGAMQEISSLEELLSKVLAENKVLTSKCENLSSILKDSGTNNSMSLPSDVTDLDGVLELNNDGVPKKKPTIYNLQCRKCKEFHYIGQTLGEVTHKVDEHFEDTWRKVKRIKNPNEPARFFSNEFGRSDFIQHIADHNKEAKTRKEVRAWCRNNIRIAILTGEDKKINVDGWLLLLTVLEAAEREKEKAIADADGPQNNYTRFSKEVETKKNNTVSARIARAKLNAASKHTPQQKIC